MTEYTEVIDNSFSFPNITIKRMLKDGIQYGWKAYPNEGYVVYNPNEENWIQDSPGSEPHLVYYYYTMVGLPLNYNFDNFPYIAVLRSDVDNNHEVM